MICGTNQLSTSIAKICGNLQHLLTRSVQFVAVVTTNYSNCWDCMWWWCMSVVLTCWCLLLMLPVMFRNCCSVCPGCWYQLGAELVKSPWDCSAKVTSQSCHNYSYLYPIVVTSQSCHNYSLLTLWLHLMYPIVVCRCRSIEKYLRGNTFLYRMPRGDCWRCCLLYTSDAADE